MLVVLGVFIVMLENSCSLGEDCLNTWFRDLDGDGYGDVQAGMESCDKPAGYVANWGDSDDTDVNINPGADEIPDNNIDENSDGKYAYNLYIDADHDRYGTDQTALVESEIIIDGNEDLPLGYALVSGDCNDDDPDIHPNATETADDGIDSNCNGNDND
jgi:hypothetical protein